MPNATPANERRSLPGAELRAVGEGNDRKLVGYAAVFDSLSVDLGGFRETIQPGAFKRSLDAGEDVAALVDHDPSRIIGRRSAGTLKISEDKTGLRVEIKPADTTAGRDLMTSVARGDVRSMSFGFTLGDGGDGDAWAKDGEGREIRTLKNVNLFDVSAVTYPAYPDTSIAQRSRTTWKGKPMNNLRMDENIQEQPTPTALKTAIDSAIDALASDERPRETILAELVEATGAENVIASIEANEMICPTPDALDLIAGVIDSTVEDLQAAAEADGCSYEPADETDEGDTDADADDAGDDAGDDDAMRHDPTRREDRLLEIQSNG
jgi:HK97 family phage prohead protease